MGKGSHILAFTDISSALGWMYKASFDPVNAESNDSVARCIGWTKTMLFIGTPLVVKCWSSFIHSWRYCRCHSWIRCGTHLFPLFSKWRRQFKKYYAVRMTYASLLSFPINNSSVSVLIFVEANASFISLNQAVCFSSVSNTLRE